MKLLKIDRLEIRKAYFLEAFQKPAEEMAIVSFGGCNFACPYCKRDCQYIDADGNVIKTHEVEMAEVLRLIDTEATKGRRIRLSGGDPVMFPAESLTIAQHVMEKFGQKISIAHNGSSLRLVQKLASHLEYIALDYKAYTKEAMALRTGVANPPMRQKEILDFCLQAGILVDVRTPIFGETSLEELRLIGAVLAQYPNAFWTLRKYNPVKGCNFAPTTVEQVTELAHQLKGEIPWLRIGVRNYWKGGFDFI